MVRKRSEIALACEKILIGFIERRPEGSTAVKRRNPLTDKSIQFRNEKRIDRMREGLE
jgi:hypothetical protein